MNVNAIFKIEFHDNIQFQIFSLCISLKDLFRSWELVIMLVHMSFESLHTSSVSWFHKLFEGQWRQQSRWISHPIYIDSTVCWGQHRDWTDSIWSGNIFLYVLPYHFGYLKTVWNKNSRIVFGNAKRVIEYFNNMGNRHLLIGRPLHTLETSNLSWLVSLCLENCVTKNHMYHMQQTCKLAGMTSGLWCFL